MDQVSLPMRIALLAVLAFSGLWLVALRPKPAAVAPLPPAQPANGVLNAPNKAKAAVEKANDVTAKAEATAKATSEGKAGEAAAAKADTAKPSSTPAAKPAAKPARDAAKAKSADDSAKPAVQAVLDDIAAKKVVVLLFWNAKGSDDREVRRAVGAVNRRGSKVTVHTAPISQLGAFERITRGLQVVTTPSVLVIDAKKQTRIISGLTGTREIDQKVDLALASK